MTGIDEVVVMMAQMIDEVMVSLNLDTVKASAELAVVNAALHWREEASTGVRSYRQALECSSQIIITNFLSVI